jgi:cell division protein FtsB
MIVKRFSEISKFPRTPDGLRAIVDRAVVNRAPQAEAFAVSWIERVRPTMTRVYESRRRIATIAVAALAAFLFAHVMLGANGMVVYKQKRAENAALRRQILEEQQENDRYTQQIQALKSDQKAIEKEAREQLGYAKPGEYVYVPPTPAKPAPPANHSAKK